MASAGNENDPTSGGHAWIQEIPEEQWSVYQKVIAGLQARDISFALGGAFAVATYTGRWRNTKDLDFYIHPDDRTEAVEVTKEAGLIDLFDKAEYVQDWIYRAYLVDRQGGDTIVDLIWAMANNRTQVDEIWLTRGPRLEARGHLVQVVPPEEMIWAKLYVLQKERCDWSDIFNILSDQGPSLDWQRLLDRLGSDAPLLQAALSVYAWLSPVSAQTLPKWLWDQLDIAAPRPHPSPEVMRHRANLLDTRPWFAPLLQD